MSEEPTKMTAAETLRAGDVVVFVSEQLRVESVGVESRFVRVRARSTLPGCPMVERSYRREMLVSVRIDQLEVDAVHTIGLIEFVRTGTQSVPLGGDFTMLLGHDSAVRRAVIGSRAPLDDRTKMAFLIGHDAAVLRYLEAVRDRRQRPRLTLDEANMLLDLLPGSSELRWVALADLTLLGEMIDDVEEALGKAKLQFFPVRVERLEEVASTFWLDVRAADGRLVRVTGDFDAELRGEDWKGRWQLRASVS